MRIGFDAKRAFHNKRGLGNYSRNLIKGLDLYGDEQDKYLCYGSKPNPKIFNVNKSLSSKVEICTPSNLWKYVPSLWRSFYLSTEAHQHDLDIYHGLSHELPFGIEKYSYKKVVTIHDLTFFKFPEFFNFFDRQIYMQKYRYSCDVADKIIAIGEQTKKDLVDLFHVNPSKIEVIYQSVHPRFYLEKSESKRPLDFPYVLYVGALDKHKNLKGLVRGFKRIIPYALEKLVIITRGGSEHDYIKKVLTGKLRDKVVVLNTIDNNMLAPYIHHASAVIFPSFYEGFGLPVMEAFACRTPVALSNLPVFHEVAGDLGFYFNQKNYDDIAENILRAMNKKSDSAFLDKCFNRACNFNLENSTRRMIDFYKALLASPLK